MILTSYFNKTHPIYGRMYNHPNACGIARRYLIEMEKIEVIFNANENR